METYPAFTRFAPAILKVYRRDKEAFWAAVFLNIELPFIAGPQQALVVIAALMAGKIFISLVHYLLDCV